MFVFGAVLNPDFRKIDFCVFLCIVIFAPPEQNPSIFVV